MKPDLIFQGGASAKVRENGSKAENYSVMRIGGRHLYTNILENSSYLFLDIQLQFFHNICHYGLKIVNTD